MSGELQVGIIVLSIAAVVAGLIAGVFALVINGLWAIYLKFEAIQHAKEKKLWNVMEMASTLPLAQAVELLRDADMYYDFNAKWRGKQLRLPRSFWRSTEHYFNAPLKARTLVTIATSAINDKDCFVSRNIVDGMLESLASQAKRTPTRVIAVVSLLAQQIVANTKLAVLSSEFDNIGIYNA